MSEKTPPDFENVMGIKNANRNAYVFWIQSDSLAFEKEVHKPRPQFGRLKACACGFHDFHFMIFTASNTYLGKCQFNDGHFKDVETGSVHWVDTGERIRNA